MRTFIILLLLTNLAYFGWHRGGSRDASPAAPAATMPARSESALLPFEPAAQTLALLSELTEAQRQALGLPPASSAFPGESLETTAESAAEAELPVAAAATRPWCAELGPFDTPDEGHSLQPALAALGVAATLKTRQVAVSSTFWVYLPPLDSEEELRRVQAELQARGIDHYYMRSGQFTGGISLGVFSRQASAEQAQADLALRGYRTRIGEVLREEPRSFLQLRVPDAALLEQAAWRAFRSETAAWALAENVCESVASDF